MSPPADPFGIAYAVRVEDGQVVARSETVLAPASGEPDASAASARPPAPEVVSPPPGEERLGPRVREWLETRPSEDVERFVLHLVDPFEVPRFPGPFPDDLPGSSADLWARRRAERLARELADRRAEEYLWIEKLLGVLCPELRVADRFWLVQGLEVEMPLSCIRQIGQAEGVVRVEAGDTGISPPLFVGETGSESYCGRNCVAIARGQIRSDPYYDYSLAGSRFGMLDTGLDLRQVLFEVPPSPCDGSRICRVCDCVTAAEPADAVAGCRCDPQMRTLGDLCDHGTKTGTILSANRALGDGFRGVTAIFLDSFLVYGLGREGRCTLDTGAVVRGFEAAILSLARVIVAEVQAESGSIISAAANRAFDAGAVVVAANGNVGPCPKTVRSPAEARRVIGVGAYNVEVGCLFDMQSRGPAVGGRLKPDVLAPTDTRTGDATGPRGIGIFQQTSGATPYAAGAAGLLHDWLVTYGPSRDPGQTYAQLILSGQNAFPFGEANACGAGPIELPGDGTIWWGKVALGAGGTVEVALELAEAADTFDAALWWPEHGPELPRSIALQLVDPAGARRAESVQPESVFQRARAGGSGDLEQGLWQLRIESRDPVLPGGSQTVYWAAYAHHLVGDHVPPCPRSCSSFHCLEPPPG